MVEMEGNAAMTADLPLCHDTNLVAKVVQTRW